jgi:predicted nucleotidyltransferase
MSRKETILAMLGSHADALRRMGVSAIGLFGSVARGEDTASSDVDVFVEFEKQGNTFRNFNALCDFLDRYLGDNYDLVTRNSLSPYMGPHILDEVEYAVLA